MDVIRDLQNPALSSVEERSRTRPVQLLSGFLHERKHSRDVHHLTAVQEQQETRKTSSEDGRRVQNRTHLSKLKSLLENLGLTHAPARNLDDLVSSKPKARGPYDNRVHTEPSRIDLAVGLGSSEHRLQRGVVATIGCPIDLEPRPDYWDDGCEPAPQEQPHPPACLGEELKSPSHYEGHGTIDIEPPKPCESKAKLASHQKRPDQSAFLMNVNVANQKIFCMPLVADFPMLPHELPAPAPAPTPASPQAHPGSSSLSGRYSASVATTPSYAQSTQIGSSLSLAKPSLDQA